MATKFLTGVDGNNQRARSFADPSSATDLATKQYVDNYIDGLRWRTAVRVATTTAGVLATDFENGDSVDGVTLATNDRILIKDQAVQTANGIYVVAATGAPTRATDADSSAELDSAAVLVLEGTTNGDKAFVQTTTSPTIGVSNILWTQFGGGTAYTADGSGIELSGTQFALELDGTSLSKSGSGLRIGSAAAANGLTESSGLLSVGAGTGITVNANDVAVDPAVVARKYSTTIGNGSLTSFTITHNLGIREVHVGIFEAGSPYTEVYADITHDTTNTVVVVFATAPSASQYTVVVIG